MVGDVSFFLLSSATSEVFPKNTMDAIVASPSEMVILRRQGTSLDMILFSTDYLLARMPSFLHRKVHDAITGETSSPMSLQDYATLLENGSGNDKARERARLALFALARTPVLFTCASIPRTFSTKCY